MLCSAKKKYIILSFLLLSSLVPLLYLIKLFYPLPGYPVYTQFFSVGGDEVTYMAAAKSVLWSFQNPFFFNNITIFHDPFLGSPYMWAFIGTVSYIFSADTGFVYILFRFMFSFLFFIVVYETLKLFFKSKFQRNISFLFYLTLGGIGGMVYILLYLFQGSIPENVAGVLLFNGVSNNPSIYHVASMLFGYLSWIFLFNNKRALLTALCLGLSVLIYPLFGTAFILSIMIYWILTRNKDCIKIILLGSLAFLPWIISYLQYSSLIYKNGALRNYINAPVFFLQGFIIIAFAVLYITKYYRPKSDIKIDFIIMFTALILPLMLMPSSLSPLPNPQRFIWIVFFPLAIIGTKGIFILHEKKKISTRIIIILLAISSLTFVIGHAQMYAGIYYSNRTDVYLSYNEYNSLLYLKQQAFGNVLTTERLGNYVPFISEKRSTGILYYYDNPFFADLDKAYNSGNNKDVDNLIDKYDIKYVLLPRNDTLSQRIQSIRPFKKLYENDEFYLIEIEQS